MKEQSDFFLSVFCQIVYSQEVTEIIIGFISLCVGISCNTVSGSCHSSSFVESVFTDRI